MPVCTGTVLMSRAVSPLGNARAIALALPDAVEADHWGRPSFRIRGRIFATAPDDRHLNVMIDAMDVDGVLRQAPESCAALWWGKKLSGVRVDLDLASPKLVGDLLRAAWRSKSVSSRTGRAAPAARKR